MHRFGLERAALLSAFANSSCSSTGNPFHRLAVYQYAHKLPVSRPRVLLSNRSTPFRLGIFSRITLRVRVRACPNEEKAVGGSPSRTRPSLHGRSQPDPPRSAGKTHPSRRVIAAEQQGRQD